MGMFIGIERVKIHLPGVRSLKEKRKYLSSLKDRFRKKLNLSVSETDHQDLSQCAELGICGVCQNKKTLEQLFQKAASILKRYPQLIISSDGVTIARD